MFNAAEINSSFHRPHRRETYARWAESVPLDFRFAVKVPKDITHVLRLAGCASALDEFFGQAHALGDRLGCILVQLPPKLELDAAVAGRFLRVLRARHAGAIAIEPRNVSWFTPRADELLQRHGVSRVAADPPRAEEDEAPGGARELAYHRLHGSPRMYYSSYEPPFLDALAAALRLEAAGGSEAWCMFDNTAGRAAVPDALYLVGKLCDTEKGT